MKINELENGITDAWFNQGSFECWKVPNPVQYKTALDGGTIETLEGPVNYRAGFKIITGPKGEQYPVPPAKFADLYNVESSTAATPKKIVKQAKIADHDGSVPTSWGETMHYTAGNDYIVKHGANDYGVVKKDIFAQTYDTSKA
jgi:hypothetical protein